MSAAERYKRVGDLCYEALQLPSPQRPTFLDRACEDDEELRREIESLLVYESQAESLGEKSALTVLAQDLANDPGQSLTGRHMGHFRVLSPLGKGGMGEVYLALDQRLGRKVAIKILLPEFTSNKILVERFDQEARAASALNHPNIITVYEIDEFDGLHFIAMELVEGQTLRQLMNNQPGEQKSALEIAIQIASALNAAHNAGIIHRDIKPENIMIRPDGLVKVLDFGLAKLTEVQQRETVRLPPGEKDETLILASPPYLPDAPRTVPGAVMGTVAYMSPEQAEGQTVDSRTDLFSLGVVLYEMLAGRLPFAGSTPVDTIASIVQKESASLSIQLPQAPAALEQVMARALCKDRDKRYQQAQELLSDLNQLREKLIAGTVASSGDGSLPVARFLLRRSVVATILIIAIAVTLLSVWRYRHTDNGASPKITSLAVLPLKSINKTTADDYLGFGIANEIITSTSQIRGLAVRPTSAIRKYSSQETDALQAGQEQRVETVLEGTLQHEGEHLRVSLNLLRVDDGASLWTEKFDLPFTEIFRLQDEVARQVAVRLRIELSKAERARLARRYTSNPTALDFYMQGMYYFDDIRWADSIKFFQQAVATDPKFATAHAFLGYASALTAISDEDKSDLIERAKIELDMAEKLDPELAIVHVARHVILWSQYEGFQTEAAIRGLLRAQELDPSVGHVELGALYAHLGLDKWKAEMKLAQEYQPANRAVSEYTLLFYLINNLPDETLATQRDVEAFKRSSVLWHIEKKDVKTILPLIEKLYQQNPEGPVPRSFHAIALALQGKQQEAEAAAPGILEHARVDPGYHHLTHTMARIYALGGKSEEAVKWLRVTVDKGFPDYPLFLRDPYLDGIRQHAVFVQFMAEMRSRWENYRREFAD